MTRDEAVTQTRQWMERGITEREIRDQLERQGFAGRAAYGVVQEAYRSRLKMYGKRSYAFEKKQLIVFCIGALCVLGSPFTAAPWSMFGGFNITMFIVAGLGIALMIGAVKLRPKLK